MTIKPTRDRIATTSNSAPEMALVHGAAGACVCAGTVLATLTLITNGETNAETHDPSQLYG
jgi:hypothetical protein